MSVSRRDFLAANAATGRATAAPAMHGAESNKEYRTAPKESGFYHESLDKTKPATAIVATSRTLHTS